MNNGSLQGPQHGRLFRWVAFFSRLRFGYLLRSLGHRRILTGIFLFCAGVTALSTITMMAYLTDLMLLFPPLGPSAFIIFHTPLAQTASPRNVILSHSLALAAGLASLALSAMIHPQISSVTAASMNWHDITAVALAMGMISVGMVSLHCIHPPAAATALIAALGFLETTLQVAGVLIAVVILVLEAYFFNRILGGLPYPAWRHDPLRVKNYGAIAGHCDATANRWKHLAAKTFQRR